MRKKQPRKTVPIPAPATPSGSHRKSEIENTKSEIVLLAVTGMSPAVLTETLWALAHPTDGQAPVIPDRVVVVTTTDGRDEINRQLFARTAEGEGCCVWEAFRAALVAAGYSLHGKLRFGTTGDDVRVFTTSDPRTGQTQELADIRTPADNAAAADFLLRQVREIVETPDSRLIASLAGGRKTMGALLYACLSLIGRETDRLTHVLVNAPFEDPRLKPRFYFPTQASQSLVLPDGTPAQAARARIELADLPFVPLRNRFRELEHLPGSFVGVVRHFSQALRELAGHCPEIEFLDARNALRVGSHLVSLDGNRALLVLRFLCEASAEVWEFRDQQEAAELFKAWNGYAPDTTHVDKRHQALVADLQRRRAAKPGPDWTKATTSDDIKRPLNQLRTHLKNQGSPWVPERRTLRLPPFRMAAARRGRPPTRSAL